MMTLTASTRTNEAPAKAAPPRSTEDAVATARPAARRTGFWQTLLRALSAAAC